MTSLQTTIQRISRILHSSSYGLLLLRVATGSVFLYHGLRKLGDMAQTIRLYDTLGFSPTVVGVVTWVQILGGIALILGIAPRVTAAILALQILFSATILSTFRGIEGVEYQLFLAVVCSSLVLIGPGPFSLMRMECRNCHSMFCIRKDKVCIIQEV